MTYYNMSLQSNCNTSHLYKQQAIVENFIPKRIWQSMLYSIIHRKNASANSFPGNDCHFRSDFLPVCHTGRNSVSPLNFTKK